MWPWEHVAVAYLAFSIVSHGIWREPPTRASAIVAVVAGIAPDLIDKPLAWWLAVLPSGRTLAHSLVVTTPIIAGVLLVGWLVHERPIAVAFVIGHLTHLGGDIVYPLVVKGELRLGFLFWPLVPATGGAVDSAMPHISELASAFLQFLATPWGVFYLAADVLLMGLAVIVWITDGMPGLPRAS